MHDALEDQRAAKPCINSGQRKVTDYFVSSHKTDKTQARKVEDVFHVHENVLCQTSGFFQTATKPIWNGEPQRPIDLTNEVNSIFEQYLHWL